MTDFEELYREYFNDVYLYIKRLSGDEHLAQEITSDTFFQAMRAIDRFRGDCDVRVWLCQIAKNCYYSRIRRAKRVECVPPEAAQALPDPTPAPEQELAEQEEVVRIQRILHDIPEPYREVFMWRVYAALSFKQIAGIFSKNENWACVTYHRARKMIKQRLEEWK